MNSTRTKIFTGKLYFLTELAVATSFFSMITLVFYTYTEDESFYIAFYYVGIFLALQFIWQLIQEKQENDNDEDEHYPLKISVFCIVSTVLGVLFLFIYFVFFFDVLRLNFKPIMVEKLNEIKSIDTKPDEYIRIKAVYDDYFSMTYSLNMFDGTDQSVTGCGCGVEFGTLGGTIGSPASPGKFWKKEFDNIIFFPTMSCFCGNATDCEARYNSSNYQLYYRINGNEELALKNKNCPPEDDNFIQVYKGARLGQDIQIILLFTLSYIPWLFCTVNFFINYTKMGFLAFIKTHRSIKPGGVGKMIFYFFFKWSMLILLTFFVAQEILGGNTSFFIYAIAGVGTLPGIVIGGFFFIYNPNFKFKQELKNNLKELKDYAESTHESVENFFDLCVVFLSLQLQYLSKMIKELLVSMTLKGLAQSIFLFAFIAPEFLSEFLEESAFMDYPTNIRDNMIVNSMILITGICHGLLMGVLITLYQIYFTLTARGIAAASLCFTFFIISCFWILQQWFKMKHLKRALACHISWLYPSTEIRLNRIMVNLYFDQRRSEQSEDRNDVNMQSENRSFNADIIPNMIMNNSR